MLARHRADPSIIGAFADKSEFIMKIKSSDRYHRGEAPVGTVSQYYEKHWMVVDLEKDIEARLAYANFKASTGNASVPPME